MTTPLQSFQEVAEAAINGDELARKALPYLAKRIFGNLYDGLATEEIGIRAEEARHARHTEPRRKPLPELVFSGVPPGHVLRASDNETGENYYGLADKNGVARCKHGKTWPDHVCGLHELVASDGECLGCTFEREIREAK